MDKCLLTVVGYIDESTQSGASYVSQILGSFKDFILYRKLQTTPLLDIKLPNSKPVKRVEPLTSSDEINVQGAGKRLYLSFRSLVQNPSFGAAKVQSAKRQLVRSASILRHRYLPFSDVKRQSSVPAASLKTASLDRSFSHDVRKISSAGDLTRPRSQSLSENGSEVKDKLEVNNAISDNNTQGTGDNNNVLNFESATAETEKSETTLDEPTGEVKGQTQEDRGQDEEVKGQAKEIEVEKGASESEERSEISEASDKIKDMEKLLDEDFSFEQAVENDDMESSGSRGKSYFNPFLTNGLAHHYHLEEPTVIFSDTRSDLEFLFHFFYQNPLSKQNSLRWMHSLRCHTWGYSVSLCPIVMIWIKPFSLYPQHLCRRVYSFRFSFVCLYIRWLVR